MSNNDPPVHIAFARSFACYRSDELARSSVISHGIAVLEPDVFRFFGALA